MAVQKSRVTPSRKGMRQSHDRLKAPAISTESAYWRDAPPASHQCRRLLSWQEGHRYAGRPAITISPDGAPDVHCRTAWAGGPCSRADGLARPSIFPEPLMAEAVTIAVDAMGGDTGAQICVPASLQLVRRRPGVRIILVGQREIIEPIIAGSGGLPPGIEIVDARQVVAMDEPPAESLRKKKDSSMRVAIDLVRDGRANACVSAGNTGALMATGRFVLKTLPGIDRPAIMALLPTRHGAISHAGPRRQRRLYGGAAVPVRSHGFGGCGRHGIHRSATHRPAQYRCGRHQG